ncbi:hypothetical protein [Streptomyces sp. NPDC096152]|uniref:hypothetical protein n=1 Tax=Streptomyces sp. NPDC096152 TaxID=3366078 RepID=UPI0037F92784
MSLPVNTVFARLFFRRTVAGRVPAGGAVGLLGIGIVFWPDLTGLDLASGTGRGIVLSLLGTVVFCLGNVLSGKTQAAGLPVIQSTGYSMAGP